MRVALIGDVEGDLDWIVARIREIGARGDVKIAYQLGDLRFGMGSDPDAYLAGIEAACAEVGLRLFCITGNHENWAVLDAMWSQPRWQHADGSLAPIEVSAHITILPRGHRWTLGGRSFVALGSAPSVNRDRLVEGISWWPTEILLEKHVDAALAGGHAEVMLTHDSPGPPFCTGAVERIITTNPMGWPPEILEYAQTGIDRLARAVLGIRPRLLAHGHFHVADETVVRLPDAPHESTIWSLAANGDVDNVRVLDLETLTQADA